MNILSGIKLFLLDLDGTVYLDGEVIDGVREAVSAIMERADILYLTNNSSLTQKAYREKLKKLGLPGYSNVYTSANATQDYLNKNKSGKRVYLFGNKCLKEEFLDRNINLCEDNPDIAVVAFNKEFNYNELTKLCGFISAGVPYIATHSDRVCPVKGGTIPDAGSFLELIKTATGCKPRLICGKPFPQMATGIKSLTGVNYSQTAMVGDRLYTDMKFAFRYGYKSVLVLSGETDMDMYNKSKIKCDLVLPSIKNILNNL